MLSLMLAAIITAGTPTTGTRMLTPCASTTVSNIEISPDRETILKLDPRSIVKITGTSVEYNLGRKIITIDADCQEVKDFFNEVANGHCWLTQKVTLMPVQHSLYETYKAICMPWERDVTVKKQRIVNPCQTIAVSFIEIPPDRETIVELEPRRFAAVMGNIIEYDLGWKKVTIQANGRWVEEYFNNVADGRCGLKLKVTLTPELKSQFNTRYRATYYTGRRW